MTVFIFSAPSCFHIQCNDQCFGAEFCSFGVGVRCGVAWHGGATKAVTPRMGVSGSQAPRRRGGKGGGMVTWLLCDMPRRRLAPGKNLAAMGRGDRKKYSIFFFDCKYFSFSLVFALLVLLSFAYGFAPSLKTKSNETFLFFIPSGLVVTRKK